MTDQPGAPGDPAGDRPEERLPAPRPPSEPAPAASRGESTPAARFSGPPSSRTFGLTPERAAGIVRQSSNARWVGLLATTVVVLFVIVYYFYDLGVPGVADTSRLSAEATAQQVTMVERGYNIFEANCARCHGAQGQGGIGPVLNDQSKLYAHLSPTYIQNVLTVGGRYVCGNPKSVMPVWADINGGPLNYIQIQEVIAFIRATKDQTYVARDPSTNEPLVDSSGKEQTFTGWRDPNFAPAPDATPVPDCWSSAFTSGSASPAASGSPGASGAPGASGSPAASGSPGAPVGATLQITALNIAFDKTDLEAAADTPFAIEFDNQDSGVPHNVAIKDASGTDVFKGEIFPGVDKRTYQVPGLKAGTYTFYCQVHPNMTGTLTVK